MAGHACNPRTEGQRQVHLRGSLARQTCRNGKPQLQYIFSRNFQKHTPVLGSCEILTNQERYKIVLCICLLFSHCPYVYVYVIPACSALNSTGIC